MMPPPGMTEIVFDPHVTVALVSVLAALVVVVLLLAMINAPEERKRR
jgi:hypothetical protein